jgi:Lrp/AsnC family leucine-responsive transcriptional regulator
VEITLNRGAPDVFEQFNKAVQVLEEIQECHLVSGDFDYLLKTRVSTCPLTAACWVKPCCVCRA